MSLATLKTKVGLLIEKAQNAGGNTDELEAIIDNSGVLDSTEGTVEEKVERLVDLAEWKNIIKITFEYWKDELFLFRGWQFETIPDFLDFSIITHLRETFCDNRKLTAVDINLVNCTRLNTVFQNCTAMESATLRNTGKVNYWNRVFYNCWKLESIGILDFSSARVIANVFDACPLLKDITVLSETIKVSISFAQVSKLTNESIQSIIDGLATVETAQTLTLNATVKAKLTEEQLATITSKNWNLA